MILSFTIPQGFQKTKDLPHPARFRRHELSGLQFADPESLRKGRGVTLNRVALSTAVSLLAMFCLAGTVLASTSEAWADYEKEVATACISASGLSDARPAGKLIDFDDRLGVSAIVIQGRYPQKHMKNLRGRVLCLFDKKTRTPFVSEAKDIVR